MPAPNGQFLMSTEIECLTAVPKRPALVDDAIRRFLEQLFRVAPALPGTQGVYTPYGKIYKDVGEGAHLELAAMECDCPYLLSQVVQQQLRLVSRALQGLHEAGCHLLLVGNNHDGLLQTGCAIWGTHENYLVEEHPTTFGDRILPFLVTRIYGGAGGIHYPSGRFLAAVRPIAITQATGGGTTHHRAIHSTARDENHMGPTPQLYRYHGLLGDGHRCHFNLSLQFAATALALKAALFDPQLPKRLKRIGAFRKANWVKLLQQCNVLAEPGKPLRVHPLVLETQRLYLESAERFVECLDNPQQPRRWLADWKQTLDAFEQADRQWLAARLDAFAKYELYTSVLANAGCGWADLPHRPALFRELALLDHSYHELGNPDSVFCRLEQAGLLEHYVAPLVEPGDEPEPFVPETSTRARARARFVRDHAGDRQMQMDWSYVCNLQTGQVRWLCDPFAAEFSPWSAVDRDPWPRSRERQQQGRRSANIPWLYDHGDYQEAQRRLDEPEETSSADSANHVRYRAWIRARLGHSDAHRWLDYLYRDRPLDLVAIGDYCFVWRFCGLAPHERISQWIDAGSSFLDPCHFSPDDPVGSPAFRDHLACWLLDRGEAEQARQVLEAACENRRTDDRLQARMLASLAVAYRRLGDRRRGRMALERAESIQRRGEYLGDLADFSITERARTYQQSQTALEFLAFVESIQLSFGNLVGVTRTLLLQARLAHDEQVVRQKKQRVLSLRGQSSALAGCRLLARVLDQWEDWAAGETPPDAVDTFWGL